MSQISLKPIFFNGLQLKLLRNLVPVTLGQQEGMRLRLRSSKFSQGKTSHIPRTLGEMHLLNLKTLTHI